jgi:hypothetical protein
MIRTPRHAPRRVFQACPHGPAHDCRHIADKLRGRGACGAADAGALFAGRYFPGWGAGLPRRALWALLPVWDFRGMVYDEVVYIGGGGEGGFRREREMRGRRDIPAGGGERASGRSLKLFLNRLCLS